jgi:hypothetical protein
LRLGAEFFAKRGHEITDFKKREKPRKQEKNGEKQRKARVM